MQLETLIGHSTLGILYFPEEYANPRKGILATWRRHLLANAAIRDRQYMLTLFNSHFPDCNSITITDKNLPAREIESAENLVLLFPDSIGLDFAAMERSIASRWPAKRLFALNGRRRFFRLDAPMRRRIALRRFLEKTRIPELCFFVAFVVATPFMALADLTRSRR